MLIASIILVCLSLLVATHYATFVVAKRRGWNAANEEEVTLFADDLRQYNMLLERVLMNVEDLLTIVDGVYADINLKQYLASDPDPSQYEDDSWYKEVSHD